MTRCIIALVAALLVVVPLLPGALAVPAPIRVRQDPQAKAASASASKNCRPRSHFGWPGGPPFSDNKWGNVVDPSIPQAQHGTGSGAAKSPSNATVASSLHPAPSPTHPSAHSSTASHHASPAPSSTPHSSPPPPAAAAAAPPSGSGSTSGPTSPSDIQAYLAGHNSVRAQHGAAPLTYSQDLAAKAQQWANGCKFQHSGGSLGPFGENLAAGTGSSYNIAAAIKSWTDEASQYDPNNPQPSHFTQVVWKATTQVGCAMQLCDGIFASSFGKAKYFVCEYSPAGNVIGQIAQNVS